MRSGADASHPDGCSPYASPHSGGSYNRANGTSYSHAQLDHGTCSHRDGCSFSNTGLAG